LAHGNVDLGFAKLEDSLDRLTHLGVAFEAARTRLDLARASREHSHDREAFQSHLDAAQASFRTMGSNVGLDWIDAIRAEPWSDARDATSPKRNVVEESLLELDVTSLSDAARSPGSGPELSLGDLTLGVSWKSPQFREALNRLGRFAPSTQPILIMGESGAGKTAFAEVAHRRGPGRDGPFIVLNCASLPEGLVESELFGSTRGAFTGADRDRSGLIRAAANGTIFLDEIDKASRAFQATILHVLDRGEVRPIGGQAFHNVRVRFLFAANRDLGDLAARGDFLPDLDYRISGLRVDVPPVRERIADFDLLLALALREVRVRERLVRSIDRDARNLLTTYEWRGNVRELFSVVTSMAFLSDEREIMGVDEVERAFRDPRRIAHLVEARKSESLADQLAENERRILLLTLRLEGGSQARAAGRLGITRRGLNKKLHRLGLLEQLEREGLEEFSHRGGLDDDDSEDEGA
jgi:DNA-binding NtrC family response regulator